jgi:hypothetical protein
VPNSPISGGERQIEPIPSRNDALWVIDNWLAALYSTGSDPNIIWTVQEIRKQIVSLWEKPE